MKLGRTTVIHFGSQAIISVAGFAATLLIARFLGPTGLGQYAIAVAVGYFWLVIPSNTIASAIKKRVSEGEEPTAYLSSGFVLNGIVGSVLVLTVLLFGPLVNAYIGATVSGPVALLVFATVFSVTVFGGLHGQKKVATSGLLYATERIGRTALQVAVLIVGLGVAGLIYGHALSLIAIALLGLAFYEIGFSKPTWRHVKSLISYAKYAWLSPLRGRVFGWMDTIILAFFVAPNLIGIYEAAWGLASLLGMISVSIRSTLFPEISELSSNAQYDEIKHYLNEGLVYSGIFVIPGLFGAAVVGQRVLRIYREEFTQGSVVLLILILAYTADVYGNQFVTAINAVDRPDIAFRVNSAFIIANIVLNVGLILWIGWVGAAVATAISTTLLLVLGYGALVHLIGPIEIPIREFGMQTMAAGMMAGAIYFITLIAPDGIPATIGLVGLGAAIYSGIVISISSRVREKLRAVIASLIRHSEIPARP